MAIKNEKGEWLNRTGRYIPEAAIPRHLRRRDKVVVRAIKRMLAFQAKALREKQIVQAEVSKYLRTLGGESDVDAEGISGNIRLSDYANLNALEFDKTNIIRFDERLNVAKGLIDSYLKRESASNKPAFRAMINKAFKIDKRGQVNRYLLLDLCEIECEDAEWKRAVQLIKDSQFADGTRHYLKFYTRNNHEEEFKPINLNFSNLK